VSVFDEDLKLGNCDLGLARICVQASARAYQEATLTSELAKVLVVRSPYVNAPIIAFRGSADARAWLTDMRVCLAQTEYGKLHCGFYASTRTILGQLLALDQRSQPEPVIVTGHSKGGAEALICARILAAAGKPVQAVVTFGGPRVGDARWRKSYDDQSANLSGALGQPTLGDITYRWVHEEDIVPRLPVWMMGYRHVGHEAFMSSFGGVEIDPPLQRMAWSDLWGTFWGYRAGRIEQALDHPIARYQEHLEPL